ncbi:hypothetical protein [Bacillus kexueae]|uniref:hypothetical protein n=1 Tax=Aeribacillus kexueae TaxID=2078952 RepID=UPI001FAF878C|nr:hypothetical protein [Bacillus kexueae]
MEENEKVEIKQEAPKKGSEFFDAFMFGKPMVREETKEQEKVGDFDYTQLMAQIDDVMTSIDDLKPLLKEFSPIVDFIKKKINL